MTHGTDEVTDLPSQTKSLMKLIPNFVQPLTLTLNLTVLWTGKEWNGLLKQLAVGWSMESAEDRSIELDTERGVEPYCYATAMYLHDDEGLQAARITTSPLTLSAHFVTFKLVDSYHVESH